MLSRIDLHNFKNHLDVGFSFDSVNIIVWPNWSGKTNILDAIYFIINWHLYWSQTNSNVLNFSSWSYLLDASMPGEFIDSKLRITYDLDSDRQSFFYNNSKVTRPKFISSNNCIAIFFSPLEMNVIYLWPALRRDFLDEVSALDDHAFIKVKSDYQKILRNRNRLLKDIKEGKASESDLSFWNASFAEKASEYYIHRLKFIDFIKSNLSVVEKMLESKYNIKFEYQTKADLSDVKWSIIKYLNENSQRDIITWHTYIWPHLDDFLFYAKVWSSFHLSSESLSRWENKSILMALKMLEIKFFKAHHQEEIILLLDDIFAELDVRHMELVLSYAKRYQTFITTQNLPDFLHLDEQFKRIYI